MLDRQSPVPLYRQIADHFRQRIMSGDLPAGFRMPPERRLAESQGVNRSTVQSAYESLKDAGLVETRVGGGTFVGTVAGEPDWGAYLEAGTFFPDSDLRSEVLEGVRRPGVLPLATVAPPEQVRPDLRTSVLGIPTNVSLDARDRYGYAPLREAVARRMRQTGAAVQAENVLLLTSPQQGLLLAIQCILEAGDTVVTESPSSLFSLDLFASASVRLFGVPSDSSGLIPADLEAFVKRRKTHLIATAPTCANPTGRSQSLAVRRRLLELCAANRIPILEDDSLGDLWFADEARPPSLKRLDGSGLVLYIGGFGATLGPLVRTAWITGPQPVIERLAQAKWQMDGGASLLSQVVLAGWLEQGLYEPHLERLRGELRLRCSTMEEALEEELRDLAMWEPPQGGLHLWVQFDMPTTSVTLFRRALEAGVGVMPGRLFGHEVKGAPCLRLSFGSLPPNAIREAVRRLGRAVSGHAPL